MNQLDKAYYQYIVDGSEAEDGGVNWLNHFCAGGDGDELTDGLAGFKSIYEIAAAQPADDGRWLNAKENYLAGERTAAYKWLGRTMHLLQPSVTIYTRHLPPDLLL